MNLDLSKATWHKSSRSGANNNCVEVAGNLPRVVAVRDSKHPDGPVLVVTREEWRAFTAGVKAGRFGLP
jgi:predicted secreted Zn-dependent protease